MNRKKKQREEEKKKPYNKAVWLVRVSDAARLQKKQAKPQSIFTSPMKKMAVKLVRCSSSGFDGTIWFFVLFFNSFLCN